jgi:hypothetical protein
MQAMRRVGIARSECGGPLRQRDASASRRRLATKVALADVETSARRAQLRTRRQHSMQKSNRKRALAAVVTVIGLGVSAGSVVAHEGGDGILTPGHRYIALLNSGQVVAETASTSNASGVAFLTFSPEESELCYTVTFSGLEGTQLAAPMAAHIHGPAQPGGSNHNHVAELASGSPLNGCEVLAKDEFKWLKAGKLYLQIHTDLFPGGEIRGQIVRVK